MTPYRTLRSRLILLAAFGALCVAIFIGLLRIAGGLSPGRKYHFTAVLPTVVTLAPHADVRHSGVKIGRVERIESRGSTAVVDVALDSRWGPIHRNASVRVRAKTLLGEAYLDLDPGTRGAAAISDGDVLPMSRAHESVQVDQILTAMFGGRRRAEFRRTLSGIGGGLSGTGGRDLNSTLGNLSDAADASAPVVRTLAAEREHVAGLVEDFGTVFAALGEQRQQIRQLAVQGRAATRSFADEADAVRSVLRELPSTLTHARATTERLGAVGEHAAPVLDDLTVTLSRLTPAARTLPTASKVALRALARLHDVAPPLQRLLSALRVTAPKIRAVVPRLDDTLRELHPFLAFLDPYSPDLAAYFSVLASATASHDATSQVGRPTPIFTPSYFATMPEEQRKILRIAINEGAAEINDNVSTPGAQVGGQRGVNGYPKPLTADRPEPWSGGPYPRVKRDTGR